MRFNKYLISFFLLIWLIPNHKILAQNTNKNTSFWENVRFGGGLGMGFNQNFFSITLAPNAIYQFNQTWGIGISTGYTYASEKDLYKSSIINYGIIGLSRPINRLELSTQLENYHVSQKFDQDQINLQNINYQYPALFIGAGYISNNVTIGAKYDILYDEEKSIFPSPIIPFVRIMF